MYQNIKNYCNSISTPKGIIDNAISNDQHKYFVPQYLFKKAKKYLNLKFCINNQIFGFEFKNTDLKKLKDIFPYCETNWWCFTRNGEEHYYKQYVRPTDKFLVIVNCTSNEHNYPFKMLGVVLDKDNNIMYSYDENNQYANTLLWKILIKGILTYIQ